MNELEFKRTINTQRCKKYRQTEKGKAAIKRANLKRKCPNK